MKLAARLLTILFLLAGGVILIRLSIDNRELARQIDRLEAELGRMPIDDLERVHLVEIEAPNVPSEVAAHLERVWQFRCYLPPGYDVIRFSGGGRVADEGVYVEGSSGSGWSSPRPEAAQKLVTASLRKKEGRTEVFSTFGGSSTTFSWDGLDPDHFDDSLVVEKIVNSDQGSRSFDQDTILPMLRIYDPSTAEEEEVAGRTITTYAGGLFVLCPKSRESELNQLKRGETPAEFEPDWIATEATND